MKTLTEQFNVSYSPPMYSGSITTANTGIWVPGQTAGNAPTPRPKTAVEWLDGRIAEVRELVTL